MKVKDLARVLIVKTNPYMPFSILNKMPYYLAIKAFIRLCKRFPEIRSVYAFPQSRKLISPPGFDWFLGRGPDSIVERSLLLRLYLNKGVIRPWYSELLGECKRRYADDLIGLDEIKKNADRLKDEILGW